MSIFNENSTSKEMASLCGITTRRINQLAQEGVVQRVNDREFNTIDFIKDYMRFLHKHNRQQGHKPDCDARQRLANAKAEMIEIELAKRKNEVLEIAKVRDEIDQMISACRAKLLAIPTKLAHQLAPASTPDAMEKIVRTAIYQALTELSQPASCQ